MTHGKPELTEARFAELMTPYARTALREMSDGEFIAEYNRRFSDLT
jgi:hypothetical protein